MAIYHCQERIVAQWCAKGAQKSYEPRLKLPLCVTLLKQSRPNQGGEFSIFLRRASQK
jgi:hypothetical protein